MVGRDISRIVLCFAMLISCADSSLGWQQAAFDLTSYTRENSAQIPVIARREFIVYSAAVESMNSELEKLISGYTEQQKNSQLPIVAQELARIGNESGLNRVLDFVGDEDRQEAIRFALFGASLGKNKLLAESLAKRLAPDELQIAISGVCVTFGTIPEFFDSLSASVKEDLRAEIADFKEAKLFRESKINELKIPDLLYDCLAYETRQFLLQGPSADLQTEVTPSVRDKCIQLFAEALEAHKEQSQTEFKQSIGEFYRLNDTLAARKKLNAESFWLASLSDDVATLEKAIVANANSNRLKTQCALAVACMHVNSSIFNRYLVVVDDNIKGFALEYFARDHPCELDYSGVSELTRARIEMALALYVKIRV